MALLTPALVGLYGNAVPNNITYFTIGGAPLPTTTIVPAVGTQLVGGATSQLWVSYLNVRAANACILTISDTGGVTQLVIALAAGVAREFSPANGPLIGCSLGTGLNIVTSADPGNFDLTLVMRAIPTNLS